MELIRVVKRGLKEDGEGPADKYVKQMLVNKVHELDIANIENVIKGIEETYDAYKVVNSLELIEKGDIDGALKGYFK